MKTLRIVLWLSSLLLILPLSGAIGGLTPPVAFLMWLFIGRYYLFNQKPTGTALVCVPQEEEIEVVRLHRVA